MYVQVQPEVLSPGSPVCVESLCHSIDISVSLKCLLVSLHGSLFLAIEEILPIAGPCLALNSRAGTCMQNFRHDDRTIKYSATQDTDASVHQKGKSEVLGHPRPGIWVFDLVLLSSLGHVLPEVILQVAAIQLLYNFQKSSWSIHA